jgi:hypothetical protein
VPESPDKYELPKDIELTDEQKSQVLGTFHKLGLSQEQVQQLLPWARAREQQMVARKNETYLADMDKLADEWGEAVFNRRANQVQALVRRYGSPELVQYLNDTKETNNPLIFKFLFPIAQQFAEDGYIESDVAGSTTSADDVDRQIDETRAQVLKAVDGSTQHAALLKRLEDLWKLRAELVS